MRSQFCLLAWLLPAVTAAAPASGVRMSWLFRQPHHSEPSQAEAFKLVWEDLNKASDLPKPADRFFSIRAGSFTQVQGGWWVSVGREWCPPPRDNQIGEFRYYVSPMGVLSRSECGGTPYRLLNGDGWPATDVRPGPGHPPILVSPAPLARPLPQPRLTLLHATVRRAPSYPRPSTLHLAWRFVAPPGASLDRLHIVAGQVVVYLHRRGKPEKLVLIDPLRGVQTALSDTPGPWGRMPRGIALSRDRTGVSAYDVKSGQRLWHTSPAAWTPPGCEQNGWDVLERASLVISDCPGNAWRGLPRIIPDLPSRSLELVSLLDPLSGRVLWQRVFPRVWWALGMMTCDGLIFLSLDHRWLKIDAADGRVLVRPHGQWDDAACFLEQEHEVTRAEQTLPVNAATGWVQPWVEDEPWAGDLKDDVSPGWRVPAPSDGMIVEFEPDAVYFVHWPLIDSGGMAPLDTTTLVLDVKTGQVIAKLPHRSDHDRYYFAGTLETGEPFLVDHDGRTINIWRRGPMARPAPSVQVK